MTVAIATYCTREDVAQALDVKATARASAQIDRQIQAATLSVEGLLHRRFWVWTGTRYFDWPDLASGTAGYPQRIWFDNNELLSLNAFTSGGVVVPPAGYILGPANSGPPYTHIDINLGSSYSLSSATTWQQSQAFTGQWSGAPATTSPAGALAGAVESTSATTVDVTDGSTIGVGSTLVVDSERMLVTGRAMLSTGVTMLAPDMDALSSTTNLPLPYGTVSPGEVVLVDSERMLVVDVAGNQAIVKRSWDGSVLAAHSGALVYASRRLTVVRGFAGTTAATHLTAAPVALATVPALVQSLALAEAMNLLLSEQSGWARTVGSGDAIRNASGRGLQDLRDQTYAAHGRQARMRSI